MTRLPFSASAKALALSAIMSLCAAPLFAQGGLILLPEQDAATPAMDADMAPSPDRINLHRQSQDTTAGAPAPRKWVSPLRLTDLQVRRNGALARVTGERELVSFDLYVADPARTQRLQLVTVSSINLLPERSFMRVMVNGVELETVRLDNFETPGVDEIVIPQGTLRAGRNAVQIEFRQGHRIYCGPEASFDLWTDVNLVDTGMVLDPADLGSGPDAFMMGLAAQSVAFSPVEIRGIDSLGAESETWRRALVRRLNQSLVGTPVVFSFTDYWTTALETPARARITILPAAQSTISFQVGGDGARVMVLEVAQGTNPADLLDQIPQLEPQEQAARAPLLVADAENTFADFGIQTEQFSQRYAIRHHPFRLPDDWLILTAEKARIFLDYAYAPGLPDEAMLLISVNGQSIRLLPLRDEGGAPITRFPVDFEARIMQPGTNTLTFEMMVPGDPADLPCQAYDQPFLQIGGSSSLFVPYSPPMSIPDMDLAFSALTPDSLRRNELSGRAYSDADVLTLAAALARSRGDIRPSTLHLISLDDLGAVPMAHHRADRKLLEDTVLITPEYEALMAAQQAADDPFSARWQQERGLTAAFSNIWSLLLDRVYWVRDRIFPSNGDQLNAWLAERRGQAVLFHLDPARPDEIWMLRSADSDMTQIAQSIAAAREYGRGPRGQVSILGHDGRWDNWIAPDRRPVLLEAWSLQNFRTAMGNFVSARPIFYTFLMLFLALGSALVALRLVISTREKL
ncbi:cellulose biosynthesis cyclic di-GMP-binding regulatory protein BcsB [Roseibaca sp. Y0-43]|uniref:cellulose biosynthesis cyclic di-GMP-binding regulatory protein BcsB n=1 Tax=Roseibaca sp. Y0-43 TaxID=2816854 RepID=UPI001D0C6CF8|nr:cellulose biosynthesis cyclic di-GMP-binding regulatory protein BcsB [Roseibaca sp. Y0-43]MCC1481342.1 cellulose biosynthesis cyclic di-GMP-binding regulatory protein BcsB [Roseibaca sp. Y0-43]